MADSLGNQVTKYIEGRIKVPPFQRDAAVWPLKNRKAWARWVHENCDRSLGHVTPIVLYSLRADDTHRTEYVADGLQRLEASRWMTEQTDADENWVALNQFQINVQNNIVYSSHADALADFQRSNVGTPLSAGEYFKGLLTTAPPHGPIAFERIPGIVSDAAKICATEPSTRKQQEKLRRDALALYLQFDTKRTKRSLWKVSSRTVDLSDIHPLEQRLAEHVNGMESSVLDESFDAFDDAVSRMARRLRGTADKYSDASLSAVLMRNMMHTWVICRNRRAAGFWEYADAFFKFKADDVAEAGQFTGALIYDNQGQSKMIALGMAEIAKAKAASIVLSEELSI